MKDEGKKQNEEERSRTLRSDRLGFDLSVATYLCIPSGRHFNFQVLWVVKSIKASNIC